MKWFFLILLGPLNGFSQEFPISESNYFVYDKYHYGVSLMNPSYLISQSNSGDIYCSEYSGYNYKIGNTSIKKVFPKDKKIGFHLYAYFRLKNGTEYFCYQTEIVIRQNKEDKRIKLNSMNDFSDNFQMLRGEVYFATYSKNKSLAIRKFNGKTIKTLKYIKPSDSRWNFQLFVNNQVNVIEYDKSSLKIYRLENNRLKLQKKFDLKDSTLCIKQFKDFLNFSGFTNHQKLFSCQNGVFSFHNFPSESELKTGGNAPYYFQVFSGNRTYFEFTKQGLSPIFNSTLNAGVHCHVFNKSSNSYYANTNIHIIRFFPHIKKYPRLFNHAHSTSVFSLGQGRDGKIWVGSYLGALSVIDGQKVAQSKFTNFMFLNGGLALKDKMLLFPESRKGALLFSDKDHFQKIEENSSFFYAYLSKNRRLYLGSEAKGLFYTEASTIDNQKKVQWKIVDAKKGMKLLNVLTITEDKFGNIWMGRPSQGIAVYNPTSDKAKTWLIEKNEIDFGSLCSIIDNRKTLWFGRVDGGLCYYDGKHKTDFDVKNFKSIAHPLFENDKAITFISQWKDYLIVGANDKVLLFDLKTWYSNKKVRVRYLNPMEANLSNQTEQNTCFVDKRDESIWFATSDMVYQWDIKKWLSLPTTCVKPTISVIKDSSENHYQLGQKVNFRPTENSFDIEISYQTKDNMPRFVNGTLLKKGETPNFEIPNLQTKYHFSNLSAGDYVFYARICQQDGSFDLFKFPITIDKFLWQKWWFWLLLSIIPLAFMYFYFRKQNEIEQTKKRVSQLSLSSLSNQFRPHFMLNALNSIGSQMQDMPHAEKVISNLGESIDILYNFSQSNEFTHPFQSEWKLVENIIEIQRLLFIPELNVKIENLELIPSGFLLPVGLIQIPVENALLHGLRNKSDRNCILTIEFLQDDDNYMILIKDNGVGRKKAEKMNRGLKHGQGLKNLEEMINILNKQEKDAILFSIVDSEYSTGTEVFIRIRKTIEYGKIKT